MKGFDAETAFKLCEEFKVSNTFLPPTAIRMMMNIGNPTKKYDLSLEAICTGGEPLTPEILDWDAEQLAGVLDTLGNTATDDTPGAPTALLSQDNGTRLTSG